MNSQCKDGYKYLQDGGSFQILENNFNKSKFYSRRNEEQIEVTKCLLLFDAESFVFQVRIQKFKDQDIKNYNLACCFVWL